LARYRAVALRRYLRWSRRCNGAAGSGDA
jgi:hypothetical protein